MKKILLTFLILLPLTANAVWYNPFSWGQSVNSPILGLATSSSHQSLLPFQDNKYWLGTSTPSLRWKGLFLATSTAGCATLSASGELYSVGTACGVAGGEANTGGSLGTGLNIFDSKSGVQLLFNSLSAGSNITLSTTSNNNTIVISSTGGSSVGGTDFPNVQAWGNSTSTTLGFLNGFLSTASSTQSANFYLSALSQGLTYTGSAGLQNTIGTTTLTASAPLALSFPVVKVGGSNSTLTLDTSGAWSGTAGSLASNGANCGAGLFPLGVDASGASENCSSPFDWIVNTGYNSTSTILGLLGGFFSTASSTLSGNTYLSALTQGFLYTGSAGKINTIASSSINLSWFTNDSGFITNTGTYPINSIITSNGAGALIATGTQLTVGNLLATTTADSSFVGRLGVGTLAPNTTLDVLSANIVTAATTPGNFDVRTSDAQGVDIGGSISLGGYNNSAASAFRVFGSIEGRKENSTDGNNAGYLIFKTNNAGTLTEQLRISSKGVLSFAFSSSTNYSSFETSSTSALIASNSVNLFGGGAKTTANALCIQLTGSSGLCDGTDDSSAGGGTFPFTVYGDHVSTSTTIGFFNGLYSTASSTFSNNLFLSSLGQGSLYTGTNGIVKTVATSTPTVTAPITYSGTLGQFLGGSSGTFDCTSASASVKGCLTAAKFSEFDSATTTFGSGFATTTDGTALTFSTTTLVLNGQTIGVKIVPSASALTFTPTLSGTLDNGGLTNSTISGVALGGTLGALTNDATLNGSSYTGAGAVSDWGLNLGNTNTWTVLQNFNYSSSTIYSSFLTASSTFGYFGSLTVATSSAGCAAFMSSGLLTSIGAPCGSGGGGVTSVVAGAGFQNQGLNITTSGTLVGAIATSVPPVINPMGVAVWTAIGDATTPAKLGTQATSTITVSTGLSYSGTMGNIIGGSSGNLTVNTSQNITTLSNLTGNGYVKTSGGVGTLGVQAVPIPIADGGTNATTFVNPSLMAYDGTRLISTSTAPLYIGSLTATSSLQNTIFSNNWFGIGTTTPRWSLQIASSTWSQLTLTDTTNINHWSFRNAGGNLYIATSSPTGTYATSTQSILTLDINGRVGIATTSPMRTLSVVGDEWHTGTNFHFGNAVSKTSGGECAGANPCLSLVGNDNTLVGVGYYVENTNAGASAYAGYNLYNNLVGSATTNFAGMYLNSSGYNDASFGYGSNFPNLMMVQNTMGDLTLMASSTWFGNSTSSVPIYINGVAQANEVARFSTSGLALGTSTPNLMAKLQIATTTGQHLSLKGANTDNAWNFRSIGNILYFSTSSPLTFATSSISSLWLDANGMLNLKPNGNIMVNNQNATSTIILTGAGATPVLFASTTLTGPVQLEMSTNKTNFTSMDFATSTTRYGCVYWNITTPSSYDGGGMQAQFYWTATTSSGTAGFAIRAGAFQDDLALDTALSASSTVTDALITTNDLMVTSKTAKFTPANAVAGSQLMTFHVCRDQTTDTHGASIKLLQVKLEYTKRTFSDE